MQLPSLGTSGQQDPAKPAPLTLGRDHEVRTIASNFLQLRPFVVGPYLIMQWCLIAASGAASQQLIVVGISNCMFIAVFAHEAWRAYRRHVSASWIFRSCAATLVAIGFACIGTGAMQSPILPMIFAPVGVTFAVFGRTRQSAGMLVLLIGIGVVLTLCTPLVQPFVIASPHREVAMAGAVVAAAILLYLGVASLTAAHRRAADALAQQGDDAMRATGLRMREWESHGAQIAHEIKNPLAAIQALVEVMLESAEGRNAKRLSVAASELERLNGIVDGYRSLTKAAPFQNIVRAPVDVDLMLAGLVTMLDASAGRSGLSLSFDLPAASPNSLAEAALLRAVGLDRDRIKEAVINLTQNAMQACKSGDTICISRELLKPSMLQILIKDSGAGMPPEVLAKLGTLHYTNRPGGSGLGIALARMVAEQHGGTLKYVSTMGCGTTAILELPLRAESDPLP